MGSEFGSAPPVASFFMELCGRGLLVGEFGSMGVFGIFCLGEGVADFLGFQGKLKPTTLKTEERRNRMRAYFL